MAGERGTGASPIDYQNPLSGGLLTELLGRRQTGTTNSQQLTNQLMQQQQQAAQQGTQAGTSTANTSTSANIDPLMAVFNQGMSGMTPEAMSALISSIFSEGAQNVPSLIGAYANATGSRASNNSPLKLALGDLNRQLSTQAVQAMLNYNQQGQQNAGNAASQIAANTRQTAQTGTTAQTNAQTSNTDTTQQQTGATQSTQQQRQTTTANPGSAGALGLGGMALNMLGKSPWGKALLGMGGSSAAGATSTIGGSPPVGGITGVMGNPAPNYGALPVAAGPSSIQMPGAGFAPAAVSFMPSAPMGITGLMGSSLPAWGGWEASPFADVFPDYAAASAPVAQNFFSGVDTFGSGANLPTADWGIDYNTPGGITSFAGGPNLLENDFASQFAADDAAAAAGSAGGFGDFFSGVGGFLSDAWDTVGSWFADGGYVNPNVDPQTGFVNNQGRFINPQTTLPAAEIARQIERYRPGGYANGGQIRAAARPAGYANGGVISHGATGLNRSTFNNLNLGMIAPGQSRYAEGGQVQTGGNIRNRPNMGAPVRRQQSSAINYEGYAPSGSGGGIGSSMPTSTILANVAAGGGGAGGIGGGGGMSPAMQSAFIAAPAQPTQQAVYIDPVVQMMQYEAQIQAQRDAQALAARPTIAANTAAGGIAGGSGGVGEGAAPGANEADNGAAGIGPSGVASNQGMAQGLSTAMGLVAPAPMPGIINIIALMAAAVNAANQGGATSNAGAAGIGSSVGAGAVSSPVDQSQVMGIDIGPVGSGMGAEGPDGGVATSSDAASGDGSPGSGAGSSATSGSGDAPGEGWKDGGLIRGPGTGTSDSIPVKSKQPGGKQIHYSDGEFVIPADVVAHFGAGTFQSIIDAFHTPA